MIKHTKILLILTFLMFLVGIVEAQNRKTFTIGDVSFDMIYVKGGTFLMGDSTKQGTNAKATEKPAHTVTLDSYYIGEIEVTQGLWNVIMGYNNSICRKGDNYPVDIVSWEEIVNDFLPTLNKLTKNTFRLPTEAEWEYAARGGELQRTTQYSGSNFLNNAAWSKEDQSRNIKERTSRAITYSTAYHNALDIYDMSGNVSEWCQDAWDGSTNYKDAPTDGSANQKGEKRVVRGGSCIDEVEKCRVYARDCEYPDAWRPFLGFRLVLNVPAKKTEK